MARALLVGLGAVGGWLAARLAQGGADLTVVARGATLARLRGGERFTLRSKDGDWSGPLRAVPAVDGRFDITFVCTKSGDTVDAVSALVPGGVVVSVQNGIDNAAALARPGWERVVPTVVYSGCVRVDPVTVRHTSNGFLVLDDSEVAAYLAAHGVVARLVDDVAPVQWRKLAANVVQNSLTALLDSVQGPIRDHPALLRVRRDLCREVELVGRACGADLPADFVEQVLAGFERLPPYNGTSMLWDRRAGRALEVDALSGAVLARAADHGLDVPVVRTVDALVRFVSDVASGSVVQPTAPDGPG